MRDPLVQQRLFGRDLAGKPDALTGYVLASILIGGAIYPILHPGGSGDRVAGTALAVTGNDLAAADAYEGDDYARIAVTLESGRGAFVYVAAGGRE
ncbi:hypothetical protein NX02_15940 [Sphingomonas sanxanigenens DSM 19645 = NX02]|uniref:Gamma-glutamylcyclotransferase AIG2-like domain-containing protein n=1 Tax=Sphingomonas sanxanigenens DSM 19645 = NX02 TaxID=1123269 RepID=W0AEZ2_9SPHN|nr:hypothetical protein NX02_15940 [Sphingomonas sanxanigenens DSM 19645 = NX02]